MTNFIREYEPYGKEWEAEMMKLPKKVIIDMLRKAKEMVNND